MSSLDKLALRGIRSFDQNDLAVMQFYTPLTVIVGHNGSGKTTIIEALKYATTGDLPPNTKGGAFIHDPSIAGTSEVKAQVKLRFFNTRREQMVVERRLQVSRKKTGTSGLSMKTLEGTISFVDNGKESKNKRTSLSTKCAALDEEVPRQLGVSKAILENVIFCHQEESNWPLSEPAALKKKFDDIFEATKYTKALDQIKTLRKDQTIEIKVDKEKLAALKTDRDRAIRLRAAIEKLSSAVDGKQADHDELEAVIAKLAADNKKYYAQATKHAEIINRGETLEKQRTLIEDQLNQLRAVVQELTESDYELKTKIENHETDLAATFAEKGALVQRLGDERDAQEKQEKKRSQAQTSQGTLLAQKDRYDENKTNRQKLIQETATRHSIPGYDHDLSDDEIAEFVERLEAAITAQSKKIDGIKTEGSKAGQELQTKIQNIKVTRAADERAKSSTQEQIRSIKSRIADINRKLESSTTSVADITYSESQLVDEKCRRVELEETIKTNNYPEQLRLKAAEARALEEKRDQLHIELTSLNLQADVRAKLQIKRTENKRKDDAIQSLMDANDTTFRRMTRKAPTRDGMEGEVAAVATVLDNDIKAADKSLLDARRELTNVETSVNITKAKLKELKASAAAARKKVTEGLAGLPQTDEEPPETVALALKDAEEQLVLARDAAAQQVHIVDFYNSLLLYAGDHKKCVGCDRGLSKTEMPAFKEYCKKKQDEAPVRTQELLSDIDEYETLIAELKSLLPIEVALEKLVDEDIPAAEASFNLHESKLPAATARTEEASSKKAFLDAQADELQLLRKTAQDVMRMHRETEDITRDIAKLESELSASGSTATSDDIQEQLSQIGVQLRAASSTMDKLRAEFQKHTSTVQTITNHIHGIELDLNKKRQNLKDKETLEKRKEDARTEIGMLETKAKELEKKIAETDGPLRKLQEEANEAQRKSAADEALASRELQGYHKSGEILDNNQREIQQYEMRGTAQELAKVQRDLKAQERLIVESKARVQATQNQITQLDKTLADSKAVLRNFHDNVQLRKLHREIQGLEQEIEKLEVDSARKAHRTYESEYQHMRKQQTDKMAHQSKLGGEIETMRADLDDKRTELKTEYDNIDEKYKVELIKVKTAEVANQDLEKYGKALDTAIMSFHGVKMKEINDTIADLWTKTYQGTDIDKIAIKSEGEGKTRGSYNYRVVMQKDETEMDMRGRCSAGQKVLASIIIRLALAESFGTNCGILALDEPTTNLDQENILALATALADLIRERKGQTNFQLVIITHDEHFLETLGGNGVIDKYWRVSRDAGGMKSSIARQRLS